MIHVAPAPAQKHPLDPQYALKYCPRRERAQPTPSVRVKDQMRDIDLRPALAPKRQLLEVLVRMNAVDQQADIKRLHSGPDDVRCRFPVNAARVDHEPGVLA